MLNLDRRTALKALTAAGIGAAVSGGSASAEDRESAALPDRRGPYRNHRFLVEIDGIAIAGFSEVLLPETVIQDVEYREGTDPPIARELAGANRADTLVLKKGVTTDSIALFEWVKQARQGKVESARRTIAVVLLDEEGNPGPRWEFKQAWPIRYDAPDLDAHSDDVPVWQRGQNNDIAMETLEVTHEGMERVA